MPNPLTTAPKILTVASGKGGVGKTSLTLNLATLLASQGKKVLVMDVDTGLANADVQLNLRPTHDLADVMANKVPLEKAVTRTPQKFDLLAGRGGQANLSNLGVAQLDALFAQLLPVAQTYDVTLLDAAAGVSPFTLTLCARARQTLLVATPDPSSYADAYALIKLLWQQQRVANSLLVVNQATAAEAKAVHQRLSTAMEKFLNLPPLHHLATLPADKAYATAIRHHQLPAIEAPAGSAMQAINQLATTLAKAGLV